MLPIEEKLRDLREWLQGAEDNVLSLYVDVNPAKPENAGRAWLIRVKNALKELPEIRNKHGKRDEPLYQRVLELLEAEGPAARTLVLFAHRDEHEGLRAERLDLQVELPVVDLAHGRVEVRYGPPYTTPLWFAVDEYERAGILLLDPKRWRFFEEFLGEIREEEEELAAIAQEDWEALEESSRKLSEVWKSRAATAGGRFDKLSPRERPAGKVDTWMHRLYARLARLLEGTVDRLAIQRLVLIGEEWQVSHFETFLSRRVRQRIAARMPLWPEARNASPQAIWRRVEPVLLEAERRGELELLKKIEEQPGLWGVDPVLDALQMGRVYLWILPWSLDITIWRCPQTGFVAGTREGAQALGEDPEPVPLREHVFDLASQWGAKLEFVRGEAERLLLEKFGGMAALLRW